MNRTPAEFFFPSHDGTELFYRYWKAETPEPQGAILLFHRGHEHGARMAHLVDELDLPGFAFYAWDARGLGLSHGERGFAPSFQCLVRDVQAFVDHIAQKNGVAPEDIAVIAQSVGAVVVAAWAHDYAPKIRAMVLASPAFSIKLYVPFARQGLALMQKVRKHLFVKSYVKAKFLTHDPERQRSYDSDPLITRPVAVNLLLDLDHAAARVVNDAAAINIPTQLLISGSDFVVRNQPQQKFLCQPWNTNQRVPCSARLLSRHAGRSEAWSCVAEVRRFLTERFAEPLARPSLRDAHRTGYTHEEAQSWPHLCLPSRFAACTGRSIARMYELVRSFLMASPSAARQASTPAPRWTTCTATSPADAASSAAQLIPLT